MGGVSMEWKEVRLGDIADVQTGPFGSQLHKSDYIAEGIPCIMPTNIGPHLNFIVDGIAHVSEVDANRLSRHLTEIGDIIYARRGDIEKCAYVTTNEEKWLCGTGCLKIRCNNEVNSRFIAYLLSTAECKKWITGNAVGTTMLNLSKGILSNLPLLVPSHEDQRRIASILSSLDRKIELNNKINADLEEIAQAIFKNWFVDFEPFKDGKFVDSELGMIPEGWKVVVFDNILKVTTTKTGKEGIPEYSVTNTGIHPRDEKFTKNLSKSSAKNKLIRKGNLVFGMSREILNWGIMKEEVGGVSSAYNVYIVDEKIVSTTYLECFIAQRMDYFADLIKPASREGQGVDKALLMKKIICIPPSEVLDVFLEKYNSIMHLTEIRNQENSRLSTLRDTLLPRLMSGELEVPE